MTESRTLSPTGHTAHAEGPNQPETRFQASGSERPQAPLSAARSWPGLRGHRVTPTAVREAGGDGGEQWRGHAVLSIRRLVQVHSGEGEARATRPDARTCAGYSARP